MVGEIWQKVTPTYVEKTSDHMLLQKWYSIEKNLSFDIATHVPKLGNLPHKLEILDEEFALSIIVTQILVPQLPKLMRFHKRTFANSWSPQKGQYNLADWHIT